MTSGLRFAKMHGLGNDFVVLDGVTRPLDLDAALIVRLADRHRGVGCDQVLLVERGSGGAHFHYRIFNGDGTEVEHCGNGVRCVARFVRDQGLIERDRIRFLAGSRVLETRLLADGMVAVDMGAPDFAPASLPFVTDQDQPPYSLSVGGERVEFGAVSMGNPHAVLTVADVDTAPVPRLGPAIQRHPAFPRQVNVGFMQLADRARIRLRVWERGPGETRACGTGACAAVAVGRMRGDLDARVIVELRGGDLVIEWDGGDNPLWMTGPAETAFHGTLDR